MEVINFKSELARIVKMGTLFAKTVSSLYGWVLALLTGVFQFFSPEAYAFYLVITAILLDAFFGLSVAIKARGDFALSKLGRVTLFKISAYCAALCLIYMVEHLAHDGNYIGIKAAAAWAVACEFWSMSASILIIWPDAVFFRLARRQLSGEIAAKMGKPVDDLLKE